MSTKRKFYRDPPSREEDHHPKHFRIRERPSEEDYLSARSVFADLCPPSAEANAQGIFPSAYPINEMWRQIDTNIDECMQKLKAIIVAYEHPECLLSLHPVCTDCAQTGPLRHAERISDTEPCTRPSCEIPF